MVKIKGSNKHKVWTKIDNSSVPVKVSLRKWLIRDFEQVTVLDMYGSRGLMFSRFWKNYDYTPAEGDAIEYLKTNSLPWNIFDIDPYGSPFEALYEVLARASSDRIGVVCTDGILARRAFMRDQLTPFLAEITGWPSKDRTFLASVWYNYPAYLRGLIKKLSAGRWEIERIAVTSPPGNARKQQTRYFAAALKKN